MRVVFESVLILLCFGLKLADYDLLNSLLSASGCAFLTYCERESAVNAQASLHEQRALPGVSQQIHTRKR